MYLLELPPKVIEKANKELVENHKRCIVTYLTQLGMRPYKQKKFFAIYDAYIDFKNIRNVYHRPIKMFTRALIADRLNDITYDVGQIIKIKKHGKSKKSGSNT